jgi:pimeloyl-ACP methyl ester carboxylesterase
MFVPVKDINVYHEIIGCGRPILMIHGWGPDHRLMKGCMEPIFDRMRPSWKRIYFDLPGMGQTKVANWLRSTDHMLEVVLGFVDKIIPGQHFLVAGKSYGGYLARGLMRERSSFIDGLLLICPLAFPETQQQNSPKLRVLERDKSLLESLSLEDRQQFEAINVRQNRHVWKHFRNDIQVGLKIADHDFLSERLENNRAFSMNIGNYSAVLEAFPQGQVLLKCLSESIDHGFAMLS